MPKCFTTRVTPLFLVLSLRSLSKSPLALPMVNQFRYINTSIICHRNVPCTGLTNFKSLSRWLYLWFLISWIILCVSTRTLCILEIESKRDLYCGSMIYLFLYFKLRAINRNIQLAVWLSSIGFCHLKSLVMMTPRSRSWSVFGKLLISHDIRPCM